MTSTIKTFSTDTGIVGDSITSDSTLTLAGAATANTTVQVFDGATLLGTTMANSSGAWSYTTATLSDGTHSFTAAATSTTTSPSSGFPSASTSGVPAGTTLTAVNSDFTSSYAGQVIDGLNVHGQIIVNNPNVIIKNCQAASVVFNVGGGTIQDSTITGGGWQQRHHSAVCRQYHGATLRYQQCRERYLAGIQRL